MAAISAPAQYGTAAPPPISPSKPDCQASPPATSSVQPSARMSVQERGEVDAMQAESLFALFAALAAKDHHGALAICRKVLSETGPSQLMDQYVPLLEEMIQLDADREDTSAQDSTDESENDDDQEEESGGSDDGDK
ncbi:hypothetical protein SeMB42_g00140 [Synchytrium endobioticum]|uniref:Uncharacterized protein n=1 Tax=Synchytrium endobioticum TaxID=286115 RepID=A0A507DFE4_9FUNG|nr:hypothetical protein SeLEV6574_g01100 [Synchytrium endobioticum]TPX54665.1 hypothetical protein SeMB42_g00140 [Synchytrium endobioticum]